MNEKPSLTQREISLPGLATSSGIAIGSVFLFRSFKLNIDELQIKVADPQKEWRYFERAVRLVTRQLNMAQNTSSRQYGDQFDEIFESQRAFLKDPVLLKEIRQEIESSQLSASFVVSKILTEKTDYFINLENMYFRERAYDIMDLKQKLIHSLLGIDINYNLSRPSIVVADMLSPSDTVQFNRNFILGFLTDKGGKTSHAAIMARSLQIPAVVNGHNLSQLIPPDSTVILDGYSGTIILNPLPETREYYKKQLAAHEKENIALRTGLEQAATTVDGTSVQILANIEFNQEVVEVKENFADGVGLFRTESVFIEKSTLPSEEEQFELYKHLVENLSPKPVTVRTIDLGGDKFLENYSQTDELNPFLGWRAIRFCLDEPEIFKIQLRAIFRASVYGNVHILIPMISSVEEIISTRLLLDEVREELTSEGQAFNADIKLGIMIETPAAAMMVDILSEYVDFFSIGTNDLTQYVLAIDRTNEKVSGSYNTFNPAVLAFIANTIQAGAVHKREVTLCGEFAAQPGAIPLLLGMGLRQFSMSPHAIALSKKIIRSLNVTECVQLYEEVKTMHTSKEVEKSCMQFVKKHVPDLKFF